jgi:L-aspartate oxidase
MIYRYLVDFDLNKINKMTSDVVVVGSGVAGLFTALEVSKQYDVAVIAKSDLKESATWYAQGGVATAISSDDSPNFHFNDTLEAGVGLCDEEAVKVLVSEASDRIGDLLALGASFDWQGDRIGLSREGGHSLARVLHAGDATGSEIESTLIRAAETWKTMHVSERRFALDLLVSEGRCVGVLSLDIDSGELVANFAKAVILATGGYGQLFAVTTSPAVCTGDGMAMAYRAGAVLADMEFVQFHPTALDFDSMPRFLITEALRGDGAYLRSCDGERFMIDAHPLAELAPRDVVSREMVRTMKQCGGRPVYLDATHIPADRLQRKFPTIWAHCKSLGFDITQDLIPIRPTAHYSIGGIKTDLSGRTSIPGLYAIGEASCTGVHGANRLASNSLLEGLVFGKRAADDIQEHLLKNADDPVLVTGDVYRTDRKHKDIDWSLERKLLQDMMTEHVGLVRNAEGLEQMLQKLNEKERLYGIEADEIGGYEFQNMLCLAQLMSVAALERTESRGVHFREDFPELNNGWLRNKEFSIKDSIKEENNAG